MVIINVRTASAAIIYLPTDLNIIVSLTFVLVKGRNGELALPCGVFIKNNCLIINPWIKGGVKSSVFNVIKGLKFTHVKWLVLRGSGFKANFAKQILTLKLGFSHSIQVDIPSNVSIDIYQNVKIRITGSCLWQVTFIAQVVKSKRLPDAYKAKGILYRFDENKTKTGKKR